MLRIFPITITGAAKRWVDRLSPGTINTWDLLKNAFIQRYYLPSKTAKQLKEIHNFKQEGDETLYQAWESNTNLWEEEHDDSNDLDKLRPPSDHDTWEPIRPTLFSTNTIEAEKQPPKLKELLSHLEYAFLNNNQEFPVIISSLLNSQEKESLLKVLTQHKAALAWKVADIKGISPSFCTHKILMEVNFKPVVQPQRRLNPKVQDVVKAEIVKLIDSGLIYAIQIVLRKLNGATWKDHFPLPFIDQMLEKLSGNEYYCFLDGYSGYFPIPLAQEDQEKNTFTCPYGTFAYRRMPFGLKISKSGIEVDCAKIDIIAKLPYPTNVKGVRSFLGHVGFYRRFIKDFSKIARPMNQLLMKDAKFIFSNECMQAFNILKNKLTYAPVIISPNWNIDFELMCDASNYAVGAVLGQHIDKKFRPIYYASKTMNGAQEHYTTTEKELLAVVAKPRLIRWVLLENPDLETLSDDAIRDSFPDEHLMAVQVREMAEDPWYADYVNFLVSKIIPHRLTYHLRKKFLSDIKHYIRDDPYLFKSCPDGIIRRGVFGKELQEILEHCHTRPTGGHYEADITARKVFESRFYLPTIFRDAARYIRDYDTCQRASNISSHNQMPLTNILVSEVDAEALSTHNARVVVKFLQKLFSRFGVPKALISDRRTHFCNSLLEMTLNKYGVTHRLATPYHPQTSGQTKNTSWAIKRILERTVNGNREEWADKLDDAFRIAYKSPIGSTPFRIVYGKACHLPIEKEHKAYLALKT
ncbi:reverse transcriptase domain-containing protein [Tanacetum coccineum]